MAEQWAAQAMLLIAEFDKHREKINKHPGWKRAGAKCMTPIGCMPCFLWSFFWRVVACPCMCMWKGAGFACADNGCTRMTDKCFAASWTAYDEFYMLPKMPEGVPKETLMIISQSIEKYDLTTSFQLCDMLFGNTIEYPNPYAVKSLLNSKLAS